MDTAWVDFSCPACGATHYVTRFAAGERHMVQCSRCLAEMIWPLPSEQDLAVYYARDTTYNSNGRREAERYLAGETGWPQEAVNLSQRLAERGFVRNCRWVEIGCSYGFMAIELRKLGHDAWGIEYSSEAVAFMNQHGGAAYCGSVEEPHFPLQHIDYCFTQSALEHMRNPYQLVRKVYDLLTPGGMIEIQIPNWGALSARLSQRNWHWLAPPDHLHYFRPETFAAFLRNTGFQIEALDVTGDKWEADQIFDILKIPVELRTSEVYEVTQTLFRNAWLGNQFRIRARKPHYGDIASAR